MSADPFMERAQRRVLDAAESWREARLAEVNAAGRIGNSSAEWDDFDFGDCSLIGDWLAEPESTPIYDALVLADLASRAPRPSLWTRTPEWAIAAAAVALFAGLILLSVIA